MKAVRENIVCLKVLLPRIIAEAEAGGCEWFIVEQDTCPGDPFESLKQSFDYIKAHLARG